RGVDPRARGVPPARRAPRPSGRPPLGVAGRPTRRGSPRTRAATRPDRAGPRRRRRARSSSGRGRRRTRRWSHGARAYLPRHRGERFGAPLPEVECRDHEAKPKPSRGNLAHDRALWKAPASTGQAKPGRYLRRRATSPSPGRVHGRKPSRRSHDAAAAARIAAVPREVVLLLPPSPEPPAVAGEALRTAVAGALGC